MEFYYCEVISLIEGIVFQFFLNRSLDFDYLNYSKFLGKLIQQIIRWYIIYIVQYFF